MGCGAAKVVHLKGVNPTESRRVTKPAWRGVLGLTFSKQPFDSFTLTNFQRGKVGGVTFLGSSLLQKEKKKTKKI